MPAHTLSLTATISLLSNQQGSLEPAHVAAAAPLLLPHLARGKSDTLQQDL